MDKDLNTIPDAISQEGESDHESKESQSSDFKILERQTKILNKKLDESLATEEGLTKQLEDSQNEVADLKIQLTEYNKNYQKKMQKLKSEIGDMKKVAGKDLIGDLKDTIVQKDKKIRNLNTSVTLLKNFLFFVNNEAISGLRVSNNNIKKEVEDMKKQYTKEMEDQKQKIVNDFIKVSTKIPSEELQSKLLNIQQELDKCKVEYNNEMEQIKKDHENAIEVIKTEFDESSKTNQKEFDEKFSSQKNTQEEVIEKLKNEYEQKYSELELEHSTALEALKVEKTELVEELSIVKDNLSNKHKEPDELKKSENEQVKQENSIKNTDSSKDKEIEDLKEQLQSMSHMKISENEQSSERNDDTVEYFQQHLDEYKSTVNNMKQTHKNEIKELQSKHKSEILKLKQRSSTSSIDAHQLQRLKTSLREKEAALHSIKESYQSLVEAKTENIQTLSLDLIRMKLSKEQAESEMGKLHDENKSLVDRFKEEMQSVLSLKSAYTDEDTLATREEFNENVRIINEFCENPYSCSLKKIFKLKRMRKEVKSVDSCSLMTKNHDYETRSYQEETFEQSIEQVKVKHVNEGRVEDMAKPGPRPQPIRPRGTPNAARGRGAPLLRGRGMPPRHMNMSGSQSNPTAGTANDNQNIQIMNPNKFKVNTKLEKTPAEVLSGGITTPPRKRSSFGVSDSPKIHRADPFSIRNVKNEKEEKKNDDDEYEEVEIEEEEEEEVEGEDEDDNEEDRKTPTKVTNLQALPPRSNKGSNPTQSKAPSHNRPAPPVKRQYNDRAAPISNRGNLPSPLVKQIQPPQVPSREHKQNDRRRDPPPMKPRKDEIPATSKQGQNTQAPKDKNDDRSKTPQPSMNNSNTINPGRPARFTRETDEPPVTHAVVRDKSIGERIRSTLLPGFLGGGTSSTVAVSKAEQTIKATEKIHSKLVDSNAKVKPPKPTTKNANSDLLKQMRMKQYQQDNSKFEGYFNGMLSFFGRKKNENQPIQFSDDEDDDIPPPPKVVKKQNDKVQKGDKKAKAILANRYATTFDMNQLATESEGVSLPTTEETPFVPPPLGGNPINVPPKFKPVPEMTDSPKNIKKSHIHAENQMEKVRQDTTDIPHVFDAAPAPTQPQDGIVKISDSVTEEYANGDQDEQPITSDEDNIVTNENYAKAYNQLKSYKSENKMLKIEMINNQRKTEMNIDYFVQLCEDVKYRGLEEIDQYKNQLNIMEHEQKKFITKQADHICLINKLETEVKYLKLGSGKISKPFNNPQEAKGSLRQGLDELMNLQTVLESMNSVQNKIKQKDKQIKNIITEILRNVDENSEQGQILLQNLDGNYDIENIRMAIQKIFQDSSKSVNVVSKQMETDFADQITKMHEDSRYKEERINELIQDGLFRARTEEDQTKEYMKMVKDNEEKDETIQELQEEVQNLKDNHHKIEEQFQARFQEILDENQNDRDEWMRTGDQSSDDVMEMKAEIQNLRQDNEYLYQENERYTDSYRIMEAEFTNADENNNAMRHTIQILEKEVMRRDEILDQYEQGDDTIIQENQEKLNEQIDKNIEIEQQLEDSKSQLLTV